MGGRIMLRRRNAVLLFHGWAVGLGAVQRLKKPSEKPPKGSDSKFFMTSVDAATKLQS
jgi:hypothetical protein